MHALLRGGDNASIALQNEVSAANKSDKETILIK